MNDLLDLFAPPPHFGKLSTKLGLTSASLGTGLSPKFSHEKTLENRFLSKVFY